MYGHLFRPPPPLSESVPRMPAAWDDEFACALAKRPADRHRSAGAFVGALADAAADSDDDDARIPAALAASSPAVW